MLPNSRLTAVSSMLPAQQVAFVRRVDCLPPLQVFAPPLFELVQTFIIEGQWPLAQRPRVLRLIVRTCYVICSTVLAICLPFFAGGLHPLR